jgi:uncharacterized protein
MKMLSPTQWKSSPGVARICLKTMRSIMAIMFAVNQKMKTVFADTFYFLALLDSTEAQYAGAVSVSRDHGVQIVTTEWILTEFADAYSHPADRADFVALYRLLRSHPRVRIIPADTKFFKRAVEFFEQHRDKAWSLTDCTSFVVMRDDSISECLTGDKHFEQAGFVALLK